MILRAGGGEIDMATLAVRGGSVELHEAVEEYALNGCDGCGRKDPGWKSNVLRALERRGLLQESDE